MNKIKNVILIGTSLFLSACATSQSVKKIRDTLAIQEASIQTLNQLNLAIINQANAIAQRLVAAEGLLKGQEIRISTAEKYLKKP